MIILSGDQICKQDYSDFLRFPQGKGRGVFSVAVMEVPWEEASRFGLMVADENDRITEFQEKPKEPKSNLASMGIYIFNWDILKRYLIEDEADPESENDFGNNIIPNLLQRRAAHVRLPLQRLLEGCGNHLLPVGSEHGGAGSGAQRHQSVRLRTGRSTAATAA